MRTHRVWLALLLLVFAAVGVRGDDITDEPDAVSAYTRGLRLMRESNYLDAARTFHDLADKFANSPNRDLFLFNAAKAEYHLGDLPKANATFDELLTQFPDNSLRPFVKFFQGNILYAQGRIQRALDTWTTAYPLAQIDDRLRSLTRASITAAVLADETRLNLLRIDSLPRDLRCELARHIADAFSEEKRLTAAQQALALCSDMDRAVKSQLDSSIARQNIEIAIVLPFSGELADYADEIFQGAVIAAEEQSAAIGRTIHLTTYDTKGEPLEAARIIKDLARSQVLAAVGPLTSEEAGVVSAANGCDPLPIVIPAATEAGLTRLSQTTFQLSPNIELQGIAAADYAVSVLKADSAAIISPTTSECTRLTDAFSRRFKQLGGKILAVEYYRPRDKDFGPYLRDLKLAVRGRPLDSAVYINQRGDTLESDGYPAAVDCLFLPGDVEHLRQLLPQLNFYGITAQYLGSDAWGDEMICRLGADNTKQAVFPSPFMVDENSESFVKLRSAFDARLGRRPQRLASLGYDAVTVIARAIGKDTPNRDHLVDRLIHLPPLAGAAGRIVFGLHRENVAMPMYRIRDGVAVPLGVQTISEFPTAR